MARTKQTARKSEGANKNKPKRATFKGRKRDPTPEPSHPDNPCPTQVIGDGPGCNLCFPETKCKPGERQVCRRAWADEHFRSSKALQLCRQQHQQLEDEVQKLRSQAYCTESPSSSNSPSTLQNVFSVSCSSTSTSTISPSLSRVSNNTRNGPRLLCRTCNAPIEDLPTHQAKRRNSSRYFYQGTWQQPQLQCIDCRMNGGPSTSSPRARIDENSEKHVETGCESSSSSTHSCEAATSNPNSPFLPDHHDSVEKSDIFTASTCSEDEDELIKAKKRKLINEKNSKLLEENIKELEQNSAANVTTASWNESMKLETSANNNAASDWRSTKPTALAQYQHLLDQHLFVDCTLQVSNGEEQQEFPCHKLILARASSVFADALYGPNTSSSTVLIEGVEPQAVQDMLQFIYSDRVILTGVENALAVCAVAKKYNVSSLSAVCCAHIARHVSPLSVCQTLEFASQHDLPILQERCLKVVREHITEVLESTEFMSSSLTTLELILQQDELNVASELPLVTAFEKWLQKRQEDSTAVDKQNLAGSARNHLRFLSLSASQFAQGPAQSSILSQEEKLAIFVALASAPNTPLADLPGGLSNDKRPRARPQTLLHDFLQSD